jgi:uncharacterized protein YciI
MTPLKVLSKTQTLTHSGVTKDSRSEVTTSKAWIRKSVQVTRARTPLKVLSKAQTLICSGVTKDSHSEVTTSKAQIRKSA